MVGNVQTPRVNQKQGPDLSKLGFKSPTQVINLLAAMSVDNKPVISDPEDALDPQKKANAVISFFQQYGVKANELPQLASIIKQDIRAGKIQLEGLA